MSLAVNVTEHEYRSSIMMNYFKGKALILLILSIFLILYVDWNDIQKIFTILGAVFGAVGVNIWFVFRRYKSAPLYRNTHYFSWDDTGFTLTGDRGNWTYPWADMKYFIEGKKILLVYVSRNCCHIIPKRAFKSENEQSDFKNALLAHGLPRKTLFSW